MASSVEGAGNRCVVCAEAVEAERCARCGAAQRADKVIGGYLSRQ